jgi:hypothetical protein
MFRGNLRAQHGQRGSIRAIVTTIAQRTVAIELGMCRWGRSGGAPHVMVRQAYFGRPSARRRRSGNWLVGTPGQALHGMLIVTGPDEDSVNDGSA